MPQANIRVDKDLAARAYKRALRPRTIRDLLPFYAIPYFVALLGTLAIVSALDTDYNLDHKALVVRLAGLFAGLWICQVAVTVYFWQRSLTEEQRGASFHASLDNEGVTVQYEEIRRPWSDYTAYIEYEDYLQLLGPGGEISFIPKSVELEEVIAFTKEKIPNSSVERDAK